MGPFTQTDQSIVSLTRCFRTWVKTDAIITYFNCLHFVLLDEAYPHMVSLSMTRDVGQSLRNDPQHVFLERMGNSSQHLKVRVTTQAGCSSKLANFCMHRFGED
jgi:hypothetical protein